MGQSTKWQELLRVQDEAEMRVVSLGEEPDGSLVIEERTDGEVTLVSFGSLTCVRSVRLASGSCAVDEVEAFFLAGEPFLSDFQDRLDAKGISYSYAMTTGNDIALRLGPSR